MGLRHRLGAFALAAGAAAALGPASALAATIEVSPGDSIQAAVRKANPGDEIIVDPGIYRQSVQIKKNHVSLRGAGPTPDGTVLKPPRQTKRCDHGIFGVCIAHHRNGNGNGDRVRTVGTRVSGFLVRGFGASGAFALGAKDTIFRNNAFRSDGEYGGAAFSSRRTKFVHNLASDNEEAGLYIGDSRHAGAVLRGNRARHNGAFGFFLRDASHGRLIHNRASRNCVGIGLVNVGAPGGVHDWRVRRNDVLKNNRLCPGGEEGPPSSGTGIALVGARRNFIHANTVVGNKPSAPGTIFPGGIVLGSSKSFGGSNPAHNTISRNWAFRNEPFDISWDGSGKGNRFRHNKCDASQPGGLCN
jgi:parallel beta-helix repeat protein